MQAQGPVIPGHKISNTMRDYLAQIYRLGQGEAWVSTTAVAERLGVSGPATVRMVHRLEKGGLVEHQPYQGVRLVPAGKKVALLHIRRYRLVECFLVDILQFEWHEIHEHAHHLQKGITRPLEERIDRLLGHPKTCPHGDPIPTPEGTIAELNDIPLAVVAPGAAGRISRVKTHEAAKLKYLAEVGLRPGRSFELVNRAPFNGPLRLKLAGGEQIIGMELAGALWVQCDKPLPRPQER